MEEEHLTDLRQLQGYFNNRVAAFLKARGKTVIAWNEAARGEIWIRTSSCSYGTTGRPPAPAKFTPPEKEHLARGGRVIMSTMMNAYCDYPYAFIPLKKTYGLSLVPYGMESLTPEEEGRVLGTSVSCGPSTSATGINWSVWHGPGLSPAQSWAGAEAPRRIRGISSGVLPPSTPCFLRPRHQRGEDERLGSRSRGGGPSAAGIQEKFPERCPAGF